ncbi:MAG: hypothetical protein ACD_79C00770G0004 [uncultured bacterium]|nr:MAG: hypothetical protein ACD_79C00770G0004 [uncultured bacterium]
MILMIDNYDSFTWNLVQYFMQLKCEIKVKRNDEISIPEITKMNPSHIVISPGPGRPENAGISVKVIEEFKGKIPILGVCLGHQAIGYVFGGKIIQAKRIMHGKLSTIKHTDTGIFKGIENNFKATRYHSLVIEKSSFPNEDLIITAESEDGDIMGVQHKQLKIFGVQFHPESILSENGLKLLNNFLKI